MDNEIRVTWFEMPVSLQISNIGSEVSRAISRKNKGNEKRKIGFCDKAIEFLELSIEDPKMLIELVSFAFVLRNLWIILRARMLTEPQMKCFISIMMPLYDIVNIWCFHQ